MDGAQKTENTEATWTYNPGDTVSPGGATAPAPAPLSAPNPVVAPVVSPQPQVQQPQAQAPPQVAAVQRQVTEPSEGGISWTASEFVAHNKTGGWYALLTLGAIVASVVVYFVTKDMVSAIVILLAAIAFGVVAARKPRELAYQLDDYGLVIGVKQYNYADFRSFAVIQEGAFSSIAFMPLKRFAPLTTIYYDPADEDAIVNLLSAYLPLEPRKNDPIDRLMWRVRF